MERAKFYKRLRTISEYLILLFVFGVLVYVVGNRIFGLSISQSLGAAATILLIRWLYKIMGDMGRSNR